MMSSFFEDNLKEFKETIFLENTRRQYDIIELLATEYGKHERVDENNRDSIYCNADLFNKVYDFIKEETHNIGNDGIGNSNPLLKYIRSRNEGEIFNIGIANEKEIDLHKLASLVTYFLLVRYYESIIDKEHLENTENAINRSDFDRIVESIRRVLDVDLCHIVSVKDGNPIILSSSNERYYDIDTVNDKLSSRLLKFSQLIMTGIEPIPLEGRNDNLRTLNDIINVKNDKDIWLIDNTIRLSYVKYDNNNEMQVLIIRISPNNATNDAHLVALINDDTKGGRFDDIKLLAKVIEVAFLKSKLWRLVDYCYESLYSSQMRFDYIPSISKDNFFVAYHISDLHVTSNTFNKQYSEIRSCSPQMFDSNIPDLLLVTGDVCKGALTAHDIEINYDRASQIIKHFVSLFWCITEKNNNGNIRYLRSDWKKRIVFCPGNHDYAYMNELKANSSHRETTGGNPVEYSGGPMAKFTYYINALRKHFDVLDARIDDKLNFVRYYAKIGAIIVSLNSCSEANSKLQNKAHIDYDQAKNIKRKVDFILDPRKKDKAVLPPVIVLAHHSFNYFPNYFKDRYPAENEKKDNCIQNAWNKISKGEIGHTVINVIKELTEKYELFIKELDKINKTELIEGINIKFNEIVASTQIENEDEMYKKKVAYKNIIAHILAILLLLRFSDGSDKMQAFRKEAFRLYAKSYELEDIDFKRQFISKYAKTYGWGAKSEDYSENIIEALYNGGETKFDELVNSVNEILFNYAGENEFIILNELFNKIATDRYYIEKSNEKGAKANKEDSRILLQLNRICSDIEESIADYNALKEVGKLFIKGQDSHWLCGHVHEDAVPNLCKFLGDGLKIVYNENGDQITNNNGINNDDMKAHEAKQFFSGMGLNCYQYEHNFNERIVSYNVIKQLNVRHKKD